jgi:hypothetical protein
MPMLGDILREQLRTRGGTWRKTARAGAGIDAAGKPTSIHAHDATQSRGVAGISDERSPPLHSLCWWSMYFVRKGRAGPRSKSRARLRFSHDFSRYASSQPFLPPSPPSSLPILSHLPIPDRLSSVFSFRNQPPFPSPYEFPNHIFSSLETS